MSRERKWLTAGVIAAALVLVGVYLQGLRASELIPAEKRVAALDFSLQDLFGKEVTLSKYRGSVVLLGFWAVG
jgi:hypothetical protein